MKLDYLKKEALKKEFQDQYEKIKEILENISLPDTKGQTKLQILLVGQSVINFLPLVIGRQILHKIRFDGKGLAEETFNSAIGSLFELEYTFNQLIALQQIQEAIERLHPLMMELNWAYDQILYRCLIVNKILYNQISSYDHYRLYSDEIEQWRHSMNMVMERMFGAKVH